MIPTVQDTPHGDLEASMMRIVDTLVERVQTVTRSLDRRPAWDAADKVAVHGALADLGILARAVRSLNAAAADRLAAAASELRQLRRGLDERDA